MQTRTARTCAQILVILAVTLMLAGMAGAGVNGAIQTTTSDGTVVNGNIYPSKDAVYLTGGPQNEHDPGLVPDGNYYFMVTDPSGGTLLSHDTNDLSTNQGIECREVVVSGGRITNVVGTCVHKLGTFDKSNGEQPVQLMPYDDTPNQGGEYKAWLTPIANYSPIVNGVQTNNCSSQNSNIRFGFCDSDSKTDNFKVRTNVAFVTVCKFNDQDASGTQDPGEPLIPHWPITAVGVDDGSNPNTTVNTQTGDNGCVKFAVSAFTNNDGTQTVTFTEGTFGPDWTETAPLNGSCTLGGTANASDTCSVSGVTPSVPSSHGGTITVTVSPGDDATVPNFGNNNPNCETECAGGGPVVTKTATPSFTRTFTWGVTKGADKDTVFSSGGGTSGVVTYTITVTHDGGTDSGWQVTGTIRVANPTGSDMTGVNITDVVDDGGTCSVTDSNKGSNETIPAGSHVDFPYTCTYSSAPSPANGTNTATAILPDSTSASGTATFNFSTATPNIVDGSVTVTDTLDGVTSTVGTVSYTDPSPKTFTIPQTFTDRAGTCTTHTNTATITTSTGGVPTTTSPVTVQDCQGANLTVSKTANATLSSSISKSVDKTKVEQAGGSVTFNYTVTVTESNWQVAGVITVSNPNDWEDISVNLSDVLSDTGGACSISGGSPQVVHRSSSITPAYVCTFSARPTAVNGTNLAIATWDSAAAHTTNSSASGPAAYTFQTLIITDNVQSSAHPGGCNATLGTVSVTTTTPSGNTGCNEITGLTSPSWGVFKYSITDTNASPGTCTSFNNTAQITGGSSSNQVTVTVCNTGTGALTMGFWKNNNGQGIITNHCGGAAGMSLMTFLQQFNPFKDDTATTCKSEATYVNNVISAATCSSSGNTCNTMLRAQMLATALDVYFSDPTLGGNYIGAFNNLGSKTPALGGVVIDLSKVCDGSDGGFGGSCPEDARKVFGICTGTNTPVAGCTAGVLGTTVINMLLYSDFASSINGNPVASPNTGATWYKQIKASQVLAKDAFDSINNQIAPIAPPPAGTPSY